MKKIQIFSDGACRGNPGPGGWGTLLVDETGTREMSGGMSHTTNNQMELLGVIEPLKLINEPSNITITSDSQYVIKGITQWIHGWIRNGWKTASKAPVKNKELWVELNQLCKNHKIDWKWIRGHTGHTENEICDTLATTAASKY